MFTIVWTYQHIKSSPKPTLVRRKYTGKLLFRGGCGWNYIFAWCFGGIVHNAIVRSASLHSGLPHCWSDISDEVKTGWGRVVNPVPLELQL
jgi:hypothetical protein